MHSFGDPGRCGWDTRAPFHLGCTPSTLLPERRPPARRDAKFIWNAPDRRSALRQRRCYPGQCADAHLVTRRAFSLVEIIIAVGLLSVIMLGLLMMFNQTQRAFRTSLTQVDVLESGRAAAGLIARELEQMTPSHGTNLNFFAGVLGNGALLGQTLPGVNGLQRTNILEDVFFLTKENVTWKGIGYFVRWEETNRFRWPETSISPYSGQFGGGQLYRFEEKASVQDPFGSTRLFSDFYALTAEGASTTNFNVVTRMVTGVVHFKLRAFGTDGTWITNSIAQGVVATNLDGRLHPPEIRLYQFTNNAVPASVEFELGLVEDRTWERYKSLPAGQPRYNYLTNQAGRVHIFRQRVQVRNVDPAAYQ